MKKKSDSEKMNKNPRVSSVPSSIERYHIQRLC